MATSRPQHEFLGPEEWESWGALMMLHRSVLAELDAELRRRHDLAVTEFDVLITLFNEPQRRLRMSQLADRVARPAGAQLGNAVPDCPRKTTLRRRPPRG